MYPIIPLYSIINNYYDDTIINIDIFKDAIYFPNADLKDLFIDYFLLEYGEFTPIYQQPDYLIRHIKAVSESLRYTIDKLYATLSLEYNPIENYDRHENWTDTRVPDLTTKTDTIDNLAINGGETETQNGNDSNVRSGGLAESKAPHSIERQVSADNTGLYYPSELTSEGADTTATTYNNLTDAGSHANTKQQVYNNRSDNRAIDGTEKLTGTDENTHEGRIHGNVGVTTSQQMILSERNDVSYYNFFDDVARLYGEKICILIY